MKNTWQLQEAKSQFCAVAEQAVDGLPQLITKHGRPFVVIVGMKAWQKSRTRKKPLLDILRACPADLSKLDISRSHELPREVSL